MALAFGYLHRMRLLIILLLLPCVTFGQLMQETNTSQAVRRLVAKNYLLLPKVCGTPGTPDGLNYSANDGAVVADTCNGNIKLYYNGSWITIASGGSGTVTSVGLSMPSAFTVSGSPVTTSGTLAVTGAGTTSQYIRGDGSLATFPSSVGTDSLAWRRVGGTALNGLVNTVSHLSNYSGNVGKGNAATSQDSANLIWGARAGNSLTSGYRNILLGRAAGKSAAASHSVIAIGDSALTSLSSGTNPNFHIALGAEALRSLTGTDANTAGSIGVGYRAGAALTGANTGTFFGYQAGAAVTGGNNSVFGYLAASAATTIDNSVVIGNSAMITTVYTGDNNTVIGASTTLADATTTEATVIGYLATSNTNGVAIGRSANAGTGTTNSQNIAIGRSAAAGSGSSNITIGGSATGSSGSGNITFGTSSGPISNTGSNQLTIGSSGTRWATSQVSGSLRQWIFAGSTTNITAYTTSIAFDIPSTVGAFRRPVMTSTQRNSLTGQNGASVYNSTDLTNDVHDGTRWNNQPNGLKGSATLDFASTAAQTSADLTITVTGAAVGDIVILGTPVQAANSTFTAFVSAANTVTVRHNNYSAGAIDPASGTYKVYVIKN